MKETQRGVRLYTGGAYDDWREKKKAEMMGSGKWRTWVGQDTCT